MSSPTLPARWAPIAAALTGVHLSHPVLATRPVPLAESAWAEAGLSATALARVPPNQAARPTSCRDRERVSCAKMSSILGCGLGTATPPPPGYTDSARV